MDYQEIDKIFHRDGYRLAHQYLGVEITAVSLQEAIRQLHRSIDELLVAFLNRTSLEGKPAACKKGCSWCCQQAIYAVTHEFLYLQYFIAAHGGKPARDVFLDKARKKAAITSKRSPEEQLLVRASCPFLKDGVCAVYQARPMACRIYLSSSVEACIHSHRNPADERFFPALFEFPLRAGRMLNEGFVAYLKQSGLQTVELSIEQGYLNMEEQGQTMTGWIKLARGSL